MVVGAGGRSTGVLLYLVNWLLGLQHVQHVKRGVHSLLQWKHDVQTSQSWQALTLGLWVQWPGGPVDLKTYWPPKNLLARGASRFENLLAPQKTYWPPKKLTGPYLKTKLARRKTICINLQFAHRPIVKFFRSHPRNIFQIWMVILKKKKKKKKIYWSGGPVENQLLWPELARPPKKCVRASGHIANVKPCMIDCGFVCKVRSLVGARIGLGHEMCKTNFTKGLNRAVNQGSR